MINIKYTIYLSAALFLSGCATEFRDYDGTSKRVALANICESEGYITREQFSYYSSSQMDLNSSAWIVDRNKLRYMYLQEVNELKNMNLKSEDSIENLKLYCGQIATAAERIKHDATKQTVNQYQYSPPKTTNCRTIYGWTHCTSY